MDLKNSQTPEVFFYNNHFFNCSSLTIQMDRIKHLFYLNHQLTNKEKILIQIQKVSILNKIGNIDTKNSNIEVVQNKEFTPIKSENEEACGFRIISSLKAPDKEKYNTGQSLEIKEKIDNDKLSVKSEEEDKKESENKPEINNHKTEKIEDSKTQYKLDQV